MPHHRAGVQFRMALEVEVINSVRGEPFVSETALHGGKLVAGRHVLFEELSYLHVEVDETGDTLGKLFRTNQDEDNRDWATNRPVAPPAPSVRQKCAKLGPNSLSRLIPELKMCL